MSDWAIHVAVETAFWCGWSVMIAGAFLLTALIAGYAMNRFWWMLRNAMAWRDLCTAVREWKARNPAGQTLPAETSENVK